MRFYYFSYLLKKNMSNRLIWLLIILTFIFWGIWFIFYYWKNISDEKIKIEKEKIKKVEEIKKQNKVTLKEIKNISEKNNNQENIKKSLFDENIENSKILKKRIDIKFQEYIEKILKIQKLNNFKIINIIWEKNNILISFSKDNSKNKKNLYFYNKKNKNIKKIDFSIPIIYAKNINNKLYFVTEKWIFSYINNEINFFSNFNDFVILNWEYIWIIKNSDISKKNNFNLWEKSWDLIILKNPKLNKKRLLYSTQFEIKKILLENKKVIIIDEKNKKYLLEF